MRPQYEPKTEAQKMGYLVEECGEVLAAAGKTLRWGPESYNPELPESKRETNRAWLLRELVDLDRAAAYVRGMFTTLSQPPPSLAPSDPPPPSLPPSTVDVRAQLAARSSTAEVLSSLDRLMHDTCFSPTSGEPWLAAMRAAREEIAELSEVATAMRLELDMLYDVDGAAIELVRWRNLVRRLIASLPRCAHCPDPATRSVGRGNTRYCDKHAPPQTPEYPRAPVLREAVDLLRKVSLT